MTTATKTPSKPSGKRSSQGHRVIRFIEDHCVHPDGEWIGRPLILEPWQKRLILELFETDPESALRRFRWALIGVPKKNGKTTIAAALGLYMLLADGEPSPLVVCAAASDEQADLVFGAAKRMCELSPTLSQLTERYEREILVPSIPGARMRRVAAVAGTNDGQNIHCVITDELHEWQGAKGEATWHVLTNGTGARRQPLVLQITTAGFDLETICGQQYEYGRRVAAGEVDDPHYFFRWWSAPEGMDYRDPEAWRLANPNFGVTVHEPFFRDMLKKPESVYRRYFLNQWVASETLWLPAGAWEACRAPELELDPVLPLHVGIDVGLRHDSSAVVAAQKQGGRTVVRARVWENPYPLGHSLHDAWKLDIGALEEHLRELRQRFPAPACEIDEEPMPGPEFRYDPAFFERSAQLLEGEGLAMVEYPQNDSRMIPASQGLYQLIVEGQIAHDGDSALKRHLENVTPDQKQRGWRISKPKGSRKKIDAAVALAIAVSGAHAGAVVEGDSVYESESAGDTSVYSGMGA